jgi:hypothetical protein
MEEQVMLGEMIGELKGKRTARRVVSVTDGMTMEVSFESIGTIFGLDVQEVGTYTSKSRPDGTLFGEGQGAIMTADGQVGCWKGSGIGKMLPGGSASFRGAIYYTSPSPKFARLTSVTTMFEFEVAADGNTQSKLWEWK